MANLALRNLTSLQKKYPANTKVTVTPAKTANSNAVGNMQSQTQLQSQLQALQNQQQQSYNNAYDTNKQAVNQAYNNSVGNANSLYNTQQSSLQDDLVNSEESINYAAEKSLQEAYINKMNSQKNLEQLLTAQGLSGGASESSIASLLNTYGNNRNSVESEKNSNLASLRANYNSNLASLMQGQQSSISDSESSRLSNLMNLENTLANNTTSTYDNMYNALLNAYKANASASSSSKTTPTYSAPKTADKNVSSGYTTALKNATIVSNLANKGYSSPQIASVLNYMNNR